MREILFKGKRKGDGKWVSGCYQKRYDDFENIQHLIFWAKSSTAWEYAEVIPETVCQYTGLTDKNGRKIFEGDIIEVCTFGFNPERFITEVIYEKCAFRLKNGRNMFYFGQSDFTKMDDAKVIGNIFDNPELIGE